MTFQIAQCVVLELCPFCDWLENQNQNSYTSSASEEPWEPNYFLAPSNDCTCEAVPVCEDGDTEENCTCEGEEPTMVYRKAVINNGVIVWKCDRIVTDFEIAVREIFLSNSDALAGKGIKGDVWIIHRFEE
jgi:hypothetical protein